MILRFLMIGIWFGLPLILMIVSFSACEEEINVDVPNSETNMVMEGRVENGVRPFLILTRDQSYFSEISSARLASLFIDSADVWLTNVDDTVEMQPINLSDVPDDIDAPAGNNLPIDLSSVDENVSLTVYVPLSDKIRGIPNNSYKVHAETDNFKASATTRLPPKAQLDSVFYTELDDPTQDSLVRVSISVDDPKGTPKFYRYFTKRNAEPFYAPLFGSVADDGAVDGEEFNFPINRAYGRINRDGQTITPYFKRGDTVTVKLCAIEEEIFNFWSSLEDDLRNQGSPFGSATVIQSNVDGGLGVFAGYSCDTASVIIPEDS